MPNRFTAVPAQPPPPPTGLARVVVPCADALMVALASRPQSGSLRTTWVTPATFWLSAGSGLLAALAVALLLASWRGTLLAVCAAALCAVFALSALSVVTVGLQQRRRARSSM